MVERSLCLVRKTTETDEKLIKEFLNEKIHYDEIWYKVINCTVEDRVKGESKRINLHLNSLEGKEYVETVMEELGREKKEILNIPAYIHNLNERYIDILAIVPLQNGEQFKRYLMEELDIYDGDELIYLEKLEEKINYDEENEEWDFKEYKWLIITREQRSCGYAEGKYILKDLNNLDLVEKEEEIEE